MALGGSGVNRMQAQLLGDQEQEERERAVPPSIPLGDDEPDPTMNADGSASVELPIDEDAEVNELDDGSALIDLVEDAPADSSVDFYENLVEKLDDSMLNQLATDLLENIDRDKEARKRRDEQYAEGLKRTGLGDEAPGGAQFEGASKAVHPVLVEGCIDFAARSMKELFPSKGPVKSHIIGKQTKAKLQRAERKTQYMNWQLATQIKEYRRELEVLLTQLPLGGGQYMKFWYDPRWERNRAEFIPIDNLLLPFEATSLATAQRVTHVQHITAAELQMRVESKLYTDTPLFGDAVQLPEKTATEEANAKIEGAEDPGFNEDGLRTVFETQLILTIEDDSLAKRELMPYIFTVDEASGKPLALRRNWDPEDNDKAEKLQWIVEFPFIPWRGAYPIGLAHIIGSLSGAATGALRALLDSAHINNFPGGLKLKGARVTGQDIKIAPTQLAEIDAGPGVDDIRKLAMPFPFNPPSAVLFQLLEWITTQAKGVVGTAEERIADASNNMPVGTALALIEQGSITFSSIHARLHAAQKESLAIIHRLNARHLSDHEVVEELGELVVSRQDFVGPMDIEPVSDPNIFSDAQRYAQLQAAMQLASAAPQFYKGAELHRRALTLMKFPDPDEVLAVPGDPEELDPIDENAAATDQLKTLKAYEDQDHMMHLKVHLSFMSSPMFGANQMFAIPALPALLKHCGEHMVMLYAEESHAAHEAQEVLNKAQGKVADTETHALALADQEIAKQIGPLMQMLMQAQQMVQKLMQQQQGGGDPRLAVAQMKQQTDQQRLSQDGQQAQAQNALDQQRLALDAQAKQVSDQLEKQRLQLEEQAQRMDGQLEQLRLAQDGQATKSATQLERSSQLLEQQRAEMEQTLERWQTQIEMGTAQHNADMAMQQGADERDFKLQLQELVGQQREQQIMLEGRINALLESLESKREPKGEAS